MCFLQPKRTWNGSASRKHQPLARGTAGGRVRRRAGHLPAKCLLCSSERAAAGIYFTTVIICNLNGAAARSPQLENVGISVPCCDPSAVELLHEHTLGPVQTLVRDFARAARRVSSTPACLVKLVH